MRIVAGQWRSRIIDAPKGSATRPTLDKVREAVFSSLGGYFSHGSFLDLYAGSGANGLEALSRGMDQAVFVDRSYEAVKTIRKNVNSFHCEDRVTVLKMNDFQALQVLKEQEKLFDYVYLDPPYAYEHNAKVMQWLVDNQMLSTNAVVIIESAKEDQFPSIIGNLEREKERIYGITRITYYRTQV